MLLDLSDLSNLLTVRFVKFKILGSSVKGVSPSFLAELQSKTINSPQKKKKKQELTLASRIMVLSLLYLLKYWPRPDRTRLWTSWKIINLRMSINRIELPRPLSGPRMCSGHSHCSRCSSYASALDRNVFWPYIQYCKSSKAWKVTVVRQSATIPPFNSISPGWSIRKR